MNLKEWVQVISLVLGAIGLVVCACVGLYFVGVPPHLYLTFGLGMLSGGVLMTIFWAWFPQLLVDVEGEPQVTQPQGDRFEMDQQQIEERLDRTYDQGFSDGYYARELEQGSGGGFEHVG